MSADFVPRDTIDALVTAALTWGVLWPGEFWFRPAATIQTTTATWDDATEIGAMLWRYDYDVTEGQIDPPEVEWPGYRFERYPGEPDPLVVLKTIAYYGYQTGDDPETYDVSLPAGFMRQLQVVAVGKLAGFADAPWGIEDRDAFSA
jgi:hypothetical protein